MFIPRRVASILCGLLLIVSTGFLVYTTKKPFDLNVQNSVTAESINTNTSVVKVETQAKESGSKSEDVLAKPKTPQASPSTQVPKPDSTTSSGITLATISVHNSKSSCWSAVNGGVYDLTSWIPNHPGGERSILSMCGVDGSDGYNGKHGDSPKTARILGGFKIGELSK
jgi:cytochrome b involved in lipid metabolism